MDVRVRLVFAGDVGRHVQRHRGFSSCWYLLPKDAKLVGDLAYVLQREFGLRKRCPQGLELRLEELPLLATQSIHIVRDNDTIVVECPLAEELLNGGDVSSSESEEEEKKSKRRKREKKKKEKQQEEEAKEQEQEEEEVGPSRKKAKWLLENLTALQHRLSVERMAREHLAATTKSDREESSSSSSSSDSENSSESSNSSSSSSSDSEHEPVVQQNGKRKAPQATLKKAQQSNGGSSASNRVASKATDSEQNGKEPRRRRRRLRQRNGRRQRNGNQDTSAVESSIEQTSSSGSNVNALPIQEAPRKAPSASNKSAGNVAGPRGYPRAKAHVLFDEETGDEVAVQHDDDIQDAGENNSDWAVQPSDSPELAKYGPPSSGIQQSKPSRESSADVLRNRDEENEDYDPVPKRKGKGKYEERWKRPYAIVATVLGKKLETASENNSSASDLTELLASYPTSSAGSIGFEVTDIIAFKTLTLCLETWQPVLSEWQCGQVQSIDTSSSSIELSKWKLAATDNSVDFRKSPSSEQLSVTTSEISELRFLSGPSYSSLQQSASKTA